MNFVIGVLQNTGSINYILVVLANLLKVFFDNKKSGKILININEKIDKYHCSEKMMADQVLGYLDSVCSSAFPKVIRNDEQIK